MSNPFDGRVWDANTPLPLPTKQPITPTNSRKITFDTYGVTLAECDRSAEAVAREAFGCDDYRLSVGHYQASEMSLANTVLVWRGSYTASVEVPVT